MPLAYRNTPLARILPVSLATVRVPPEGQVFTQPFNLLPTDQGLASPQMQLADTPEESETIWRNLPPLYWCLEAPDLKPGAFALAEHSRRQGREGKKLPLMVLQHVTGNVLFHATDETWRWRYRIGRHLFRPLLESRPSATSAARSWPTPAARRPSPPIAQVPPGRAGAAAGALRESAAHAAAATASPWWWKARSTPPSG